VLGHTLQQPSRRLTDKVFLNSKNQWILMRIDVNQLLAIKNNEDLCGKTMKADEHP